jgi:hypothetical protein
MCADVCSTHRQTAHSQLNIWALALDGHDIIISPKGWISFGGEIVTIISRRVPRLPRNLAVVVGIRKSAALRLPHNAPSAIISSLSIILLYQSKEPRRIMDVFTFLLLFS